MLVVLGLTLSAIVFLAWLELFLSNDIVLTDSTCLRLFYAIQQFGTLKK